MNQHRISDNAASVLIKPTKAWRTAGLTWMEILRCVTQDNLTDVELLAST